jgi:dihydrofolate reductase
VRKVTYGAACSLDGCIARRDGGVDWLLFTEDAKAVMADYWPRIDTILMGRKTWEVAARSGGGGGGDSSMHTYVFSRTLTEVPGQGVTLVREDAGAFVQKLKAAPGKEICVMGGGDFARSLLAAGVVDEISLNVHPVLLGSGVPFLPALGAHVDLELLEARPMAAGCVLLRYAPLPVTNASKPGRAPGARRATGAGAPARAKH